jgi:hypothetical protein
VGVESGKRCRSNEIRWQYHEKEDDPQETGTMEEKAKWTIKRVQCAPARQDTCSTRSAGT